MKQTASQYLKNLNELPGLSLKSVKTTFKGWKVMLSEFNWLFIQAFRKWEIKQLQKRSKDEYELLGRNTLEQLKEGGFDSKDKDIDLSQQQIDFIDEEIEHLKQELLRCRQEFVADRIKKFKF